MTKAVGLIFFLFISNCLDAQWTLRFTIEGEADMIRVDNLANLYRINQSELIKYDENGKLLFRYSDKQLGNIGSVDVSYPLRLLVVYPNLNFLALLDNTLSNYRGTINLLDYDIGMGILACTSVQNHFWIYDAMRFSLLRTNENFKTISSTGNLSQILGIELNPTAVKEYANKVYLNNPKTGILVFDVFGTYIKTIPITEITNFQVLDNEIIYFSKGDLMRYNILNFESKAVELPLKCRAAYLQKNRLYLLLDKKIAVFEKSKP